MAILDFITQQLTGDRIQTIGKTLGIEQKAVDAAVKTALPMLVGALAKNTTRPGGAEALDRAVERDHDGTILDALDHHVEKPDFNVGNAILGHVLGQKRSAVEKGLSSQTGIDAGDVGKVLATLAPVVLGAIGKKKKAEGLDAKAVSQELNADLQAQREAVRAKKTSSPLDKVMDLIDADDDGDVTDELGKAASVLGGLFGKKR